MITEEQFRDIATRVAAGEGLTNDEAILLVQTMAELDNRGTIAQNVVEFVLHAAEEIYKDLTNNVVQKIQLRDKAKVKQILSVSAQAAAQLTAVTQLYVSQVFAELQKQESAVADTDPGVLDNGDTA